MNFLITCRVNTSRPAHTVAKSGQTSGFHTDSPDTSPALQAFQATLQREDNLYLASLDNLLDVVAMQDAGFNHLMLFGHNPGLTDFVNYFVPGLTSNLPTSGVVTVSLNCEEWTLYDRPETELVLHDYPKKVA